MEKMENDSKINTLNIYWLFKVLLVLCFLLTMPPTHKKLNDSRIANFRSFKNFDKIIDEKTVQCKCEVTVRLDCPYRTMNFE